MPQPPALHVQAVLRMEAAGGSGASDAGLGDDRDLVGVGTAAGEAGLVRGARSPPHGSIDLSVAALATAMGSLSLSPTDLTQ